MKGCFTSSRMFLSALVWAVSLAFRTIIACTPKQQTTGKKSGAWSRELQLKTPLLGRPSAGTRVARPRQRAAEASNNVAAAAKAVDLIGSLACS